MSLPFVRELKQYYVNALESVTRDDQKTGFRSIELHPSSFPYCGVRHFYEICQEEPPGRDDVREIEHRMAFYVRIGTVFHTTIQAAMARGRRVYGDWLCPDCGHFKKLSRSPVCPECGCEHMLYRELGVRIGRRIVGHVDGLWLYKKKGKKTKLYVLDYKTAGVNPLRIYKQKGEMLPYQGNVEQILKYIVLLEKQYDIEIAGWALIYQARDKFDQFEIVGHEVSDKLKARHLAEVKQWDKHHDTVVRATSLEDIQVVIDQKPCRSYDDYMNRYYDKFDECPLASKCFKAKSLMNELESAHAGVTWLPLTTKTLEEEYAAARAK